MARAWKKGRGKLGFMQPLIGRWVTTASTPMGPVRCMRVFAMTLNDSYVRLDASWEFGGAAKKAAESCPDVTVKGTRPYTEMALIGVGDGGKVNFWSFTSDGKRSQGTVADVTDLHKDAIGFEAQMPAGFARMAYWPDDDGGFFWVVESKTKKGWRRFVEHHYQPMK
jgi:hypothetical protein